MEHDAEFMQAVNRRRLKRMREIDALPKDIRELVHDYGWNVVKSHLDLKITKARHIRHLVETTLNEFSPTRGSYSSQGMPAQGNIPADGEAS